MDSSSHTTAPERLALPAAEVAELLGVSERHVWALNSSGRLPRPLRFGRSVRWNVRELQAWIDAGAPARSEWEHRKPLEFGHSDES